MNSSLARTLCSAVFGALACAAFAQNSPPEAPPPFPTPQKAPTPESPQNTTNASAQAQADYNAALAKCDARPQNERAACTNQAEERFYGALSGKNEGLQGNPGGMASETGKAETGSGK